MILVLVILGAWLALAILAVLFLRGAAHANADPDRHAADEFLARAVAASRQAATGAAERPHGAAATGAAERPRRTSAHGATGTADIARTTASRGAATGAAEGAAPTASRGAFRSR